MREILGGARALTRGSPLPAVHVTPSHAWVGASYVDLDQAAAAYANRRGSTRVKHAQRIEVLDVYCSACRRKFDDCKDQPCPVGDEFLRGGPQGTRKRRLAEGQADGSEKP